MFVCVPAGLTGSAPQELAGGGGGVPGSAVAIGPVL